MGPFSHAVLFGAGQCRTVLFSEMLYGESSVQISEVLIGAGQCRAVQFSEMLYGASSVQISEVLYGARKCRAVLFSYILYYASSVKCCMVQGSGRAGQWHCCTAGQCSSLQ